MAAHIDNVWDEKGTKRAGSDWTDRLESDVEKIKDERPKRLNKARIIGSSMSRNDDSVGHSQ